MLSLPWAIPSLLVWGSSAQHLESSRMRQVTGLCVCLLIYSDSFMRTAGRVPAGQPRPPTCCHTGDSGSENTAALTAQQAVALADRDTHSFSSRGRPGGVGDEPEDPTQQLEGYGS